MVEIKKKKKKTWKKIYFYIIKYMENIVLHEIK